MFENILNSPRHRWFILGTVSIGTFMATLDSSIVNVALPTISTELKVDLVTIQWVVTAYLLTISSLLPLFGRIADLLGRKQVYSLGFIIFTLGSALCGLSPGIWFFVGMRVLQAIGAAMLMANSAAIVTANFPGQERGQALGIIGSVVALGGLAGPAIGGILVGLTTWRAIFYINVPIGIIGYAAARIILPKDILQHKHETFDYAGAVLFATGMVSLLLAINNGQDWGFTSLPVLTLLALAIVLLAGFGITELKIKHPMIDLALFRIQPFLIGNITGLLQFTSMFAINILMPFYLQQMLGLNPLNVGLIMTAFPVVMAVTAPLSGRASDKFGPVILTTSGLFISALGLFYISRLTATTAPLWAVPGLLLMGLGAGLFNSPNNSSVMGSVPKPKLGLAGGISALVRNVGMIMGISFAVTLFDNRQASALHAHLSATAAFMSGFSTVMLTAMAIAIIAGIISLNRKGYIAEEIK
ncbi:MAG: MFS transporter [Peptococcaceae bacterium]|nr:MFS transporter [Peptococcaceae bacterium]